MKRALLASSLLLMTLLPGVNHAADADGHYTVKGAGATNCARFSAVVQQRGSELISFAGWLEGYLSAVNRYEPGVYDISGWRATEVMLAALSRYCAANPAKGFYETAAKLAEQMRAGAIGSQSGMVTVENGGSSVTVYRETIRRTQEQLALRGLYNGPADGEWNEALALALTGFQKQKSVPAIGLPDQHTLVHLLP